MSQPQPDQTPRGPAYRGRLLPHPEEEVVDQGLRFDVTTLLDRRRILGLFGVGAGATVLAACGAGSGTSTASTSASTSTGTTSESDLTEIPDETAGPYPGDGSNGPDALEESGIVRSDIRSSFGDASGVAEGVPFSFELTVLDMAADGAPFTGAAVYAWHCNRDGEYSMYSAAIEAENYLRGVQVADEDGKVAFTSIFPACYSGRWPHVHFEVYPDVDAIDDSTNAIATSQMALPKRTCDLVYATDGYESSVSNLAGISLSSDNVFGDDSAAHQMGAVTGSVDRGFTATLTVPVDTGTEPSGGSAPGGDGGPGGGEPPSGDRPSGAPADS